MRNLFFLLLISFSLPTWAATIYVSNTATNGYAVGTDGGACTTKGAPCLTLGGGQTAASASDTIVLNDGTYTQANGITISKALTINAENAGMATLVTTNAPQTTMQFSASITLGAIVIDGGNATASNLKPTATTLSLTLNGTRLTNCPTYCIDNTLGRVTTFSATDTHMRATATGSTAVMRHTMAADSTFTISGGSFIADSLANNGKALTFLVASTGTVAVDISNAYISATANSGANNVGCYYATGVATATVHDNTCVSNGSTTSPEGFIHGDSVTALATTSALYYNNTVTTSISEGSRTGGHGIQIGDETELTNPAITGAQIYGNTITGFDHGAFCGYETAGCQVYRNRINAPDIGVIFEGATSGKAWGNLINSGGLEGGCLRARNGSGNSFFNNTCVTDASTYTALKWIEVDDSASGATFYNNGFYNLSGSVPALTVDVGSGLSATFSNNGYYSPSYTTNAFNNGTNNYSTAETWTAANDTTGVITIPSLVDRTGTTNSGFKNNSSSSWRRAGKSLNFGNYPDFGGRAFHNPPSIGGWEAASGDVILNRTTRN